MKSLIFSDIHSHNYREFSKLDKNGTNTRLLEGIKCFAQITLSGLEEGVHEIWFVGDLYQLKNNHDSQVIALTVEAMKSLAENFPLVLVPGHHDLYLWSSNPIMLNLLKEFSNNITVIDKPGWYPRKEVDLYIEPCTRKVLDLMKRIESIGSAVKEKQVNKTVFLGHQDVIGIRYGSYEVERGLDSEILSKKFDYSFIGHNHQPGNIRDNVISVGASLQHNFNDAAERNKDSSFDDRARRGWWILDTDKNELKYIVNKEAPEFIDYVFDPDAKEKGFIPGNWEKDYYRIKIIGKHELPARLQRIKWKRVIHEIPTGKKGRTNISFSDKTEDLLQKYVEIKKPKHLNEKRLVETGREYL